MNATTILPFAPRHTTTDQGDSLRISLPSRKRWLTIIPAGFFVVVWAAVMVPVVGLVATGVISLFQAQPEALTSFAFVSVFGVAWLSIWTFGGLIALYTVLWTLAGREVIEVSVQSIRLSRRVPGWGRAREYLAEHVKDLRVSPQLVPEWWARRSAWPWTAIGQMAFDYGAQTIRFGDADEAEARMILAEIQQRFPQYRPRSNQGPA